jgi:hypothetical protein
MTLATLQQLRSFTGGDYPLDLEPGQIAFNMATANYNVPQNDYSMFMFIGNGSDTRIDEGGTVFTATGTAGKGWIRYTLSKQLEAGSIVYGDFTVAGGTLTVRSEGATPAQLVIPDQTETPAAGTTGSVRWNTAAAKLQAWDGVKWDNTSKVFIGTTAPPNPSNGDLWLDNSNAAAPNLKVYVVPGSGAASWVSASYTQALTALQPGNGVSSNASNQIDTINPGSY